MELVIYYHMFQEIDYGNLAIESVLYLVVFSIFLNVSLTVFSVLNVSEYFFLNILLYSVVMLV